ncbi:hypothetical protein D3C87_1450640 [compost metagenome]
MDGGDQAVLEQGFDRQGRRRRAIGRQGCAGGVQHQGQAGLTRQDRLDLRQVAVGGAQASGLFDGAEPKGHGRRAGGQQGGDSGHAGRGLRRAVDGGGDQARQRRQRRSQGAEGGQSH